MSPDSLILLAIASISVAAVKPQPTLAATTAAVGIVLYLWSSLRGGVPGSDRPHIWAVGAAVAVFALSRGPHVGPVPEAVQAIEGLSLVLFVAAASFALIGKRGSRARLVSVALGLLGVAVVTGAAIQGEWDSGVGTDPYLAHLAAASALEAGENPYTDVVVIENGNPHVEDPAFIEGYPYPPVVLVTYALIGVFTDPRLVSTVAWFAVVGWLARRAIRDDDGSDTAFGVFVLLASAPVWPVVWFQGWTEPLSIVLSLGAAVLWRRSALVAGIILGLALASKQYFVFALPLILLHRDDQHRMRPWITVASAAATLIPFMILNPRSFVQATVLNLAEIGFRPDTQSVPGLLNAVGLAADIPVWLVFVTGGLVAAVVGRRSTGVSSLLGGLGLVLGTVFLTSLAFPNYWFLVLALFGIAGPMRAAPTAIDPESAKSMTSRGDPMKRGS